MAWGFLQKQEICCDPSQYRIFFFLIVYHLCQRWFWCFLSNIHNKNNEQLVWPTTICADAWMPSKTPSTFMYLWLPKLLYYYSRQKDWSACLTSLHEYLSTQAHTYKTALTFPSKNSNFYFLSWIWTTQPPACHSNPQPGCDFTAFWILQVMPLFFCSNIWLSYATKQLKFLSRFLSAPT